MHMYGVFGYKMSIFDIAKVKFFGIYNTEYDALMRQREICGGSTRETKLNNNSVYGINSMCCWIHEINMNENVEINFNQPQEKKI